MCTLSAILDARSVVRGKISLLRFLSMPDRSGITGSDGSVRIRMLSACVECNFSNAFPSCVIEYGSHCPSMIIISIPPNAFFRTSEHEFASIGKLPKPCTALWMSTLALPLAVVSWRNADECSCREPLDSKTIAIFLHAGEGIESLSRPLLLDDLGIRMGTISILSFFSTLPVIFVLLWKASSGSLPPPSRNDPPCGCCLRAAILCLSNGTLGSAACLRGYGVVQSLGVSLRRSPCRGWHPQH